REHTRSSTFLFHQMPPTVSSSMPLETSGLRRLAPRYSESSSRSVQRESDGKTRFQPLLAANLFLASSFNLLCVRLSYKARDNHQGQYSYWSGKSIKRRDSVLRLPIWGIFDTWLMLRPALPQSVFSR